MRWLAREGGCGPRESQAGIHQSPTWQPAEGQGQRDENHISAEAGPFLLQAHARQLQRQLQRQPPYLPGRVVGPRELEGEDLPQDCTMQGFAGRG